MNKSERNNKKLNIAWAVLFAFGVLVGYFVARSVLVTVGIFALLVTGRILAYIQHGLDDKYITDVIMELAALCENLMTLEEKEIFPANEDTELSRLQNKVMKLVRILRKKNEDSLREQENMKSLVSDISHQLKTPIANLKMYTEFLMDESTSVEQRQKYIDVICVSVERLNFLSESMIKISRLESGLIHLKEEEQYINETVLQAVKDIYLKAKKKETDITYEEDEKITVSHDRRWVAEAVFNLLDNAVKYSPDKSTIQVRVKKLGMFMVVEVEDMAPIIADIEKNQIFQRFYRGESDRMQEGIGVGLYLSREIVVKQGGYINLTKGQYGNVFAVYLPVS